tara:strand:- start:3952 stop:4464 length:513 start_codon:yes stop_codon:yes gene_type:complete
MRSAYRLLRKIGYSHYKHTPHKSSIREKLAFILPVIEIANHYKPVWEKLPRGSFDVVLYNISYSEELAFLKNYDAGIMTSKDLLKSDTKYRTMISHHIIDLSPEPIIKRLACTNIRFMYAAGKAKWNFSDWNKHYDFILCYGPYHAEKFSEITDAETLQMGYSRKRLAGG